MRDQSPLGWSESDFHTRTIRSRALCNHAAVQVRVKANYYFLLLTTPFSPALLTRGPDNQGIEKSASNHLYDRLAAMRFPRFAGYLAEPR